MCSVLDVDNEPIYYGFTEEAVISPAFYCFVEIDIPKMKQKEMNKNKEKGVDDD